MTTAEVAALLRLQQSQVAKLALEVDRADRAAARRALRAKRLPGRKVGRMWLFRRDHVESFRLLERPVGRPRKSTAKRSKVLKHRGGETLTRLEMTTRIQA